MWALTNFESALESGPKVLAAPAENVRMESTHESVATDNAVTRFAGVQEP